eukprot:6491560-Amphidinium_carterae.1
MPGDHWVLLWLSGNTPEDRVVRNKPMLVIVNVGLSRQMLKGYVSQDIVDLSRALWIFVTCGLGRVYLPPSKSVQRLHPRQVEINGVEIACHITRKRLLVSQLLDHLFTQILCGCLIIHIAIK